MLDLKKLREELDEDQYAAVTAPLGNMLCIANAGSGKTRVLTYRIAYLIAKGEPEESFLMLTFTCKAAREMMERIQGLLGKNKSKITGGTFHSIANIFVKRFYKDLGFNRKPTILDDLDSKDLMGLSREYYCAFNNLKVRDLPSAADIASKYSFCRNTGQDFAKYLRENPMKCSGKDGETTQYASPKAILGVVQEYEKRKKDLVKVDFDDLLLYFDQSLDIPRVQKYVCGKYPNVFVDEYQDINVVQASIIQKLTRDTNRLTAVGDDAQCIYGFRGSDVSFIRSFDTSFPNAHIYPIRNNYRSSDKIVDLALAVINENKDGSHKEMTPTKRSKAVPSYAFFVTEKEQADYIVSAVKKAHAKGIPYDEIAILVRLNRLPKSIELALTSARIPVSMDCGIPFFTRDHIRTIVNFMKVLINPRDELAFWNLVGTTDGVGPKTAQKIFKQFEAKDFDLAFLSKVSIPRRSSATFITLTNALLAAQAFLNRENPEKTEGTSELQKLLDVIMKEWAEEWMLRKYTDGSLRSRETDIKTLRAALSDYEMVEDFLENVSLAGNDAGKGPKGKVRITTIHRSKGLEWDVVFLPYLSDNILPLSSEDGVFEEERRLCYVAITRGRQEVNMSFVQFIHSMPNYYGEPSIFLLNEAQHFYK